MKHFKDIIDFHGHACPGLALGYRVSLCALKHLGKRAKDEGLIAIVENNSCAVDAVQVVTGCTFGKGNLIFKDYGKQVYTFIKRPSGDSIRISVLWKSPKETKEQRDIWDRYIKGDRSDKVTERIHSEKSKKIDSILKAKDKELFKITKGKIETPEEAKIYPSIKCELCEEKVMEPRARIKEGKIVCIPCFEKEDKK
jgi:formylmethanofuran dehydrogenase subunit E